LGAAPLTGAYHYSAGARDAVGVEPAETDGADTPPALFERGLALHCEDRPEDLESAPRAVRQTPDHDPFCGRLVYHGGTSFTQQSPPDQTLLRPSWVFDVVATQYVGTFGLDTCYLWCAPGGVTALDTAEAALQTAGVHTWTDVDPFDGDPDRNTQDGTPPH
jgi:hypothetical protein